MLENSCFSNSTPMRRLNSPALFLWTPITPLKTGTATYADLFIREIIACELSFDIVIVSDSSSFPESKIPETHLGIKVVDCTAVISAPDDVHFVFVANNRFHDYVFRFLRRPISEKVVTFIHDLAVYMEVDSLCYRGYDGLGVSDIREYIAHEVPRQHTNIMGEINEFRLPTILKYNLMCQSQVIKRSFALVTHSHYAAMRLILEHDSRSTVPPTIVMEHPKHPETPSPAPRSAPGCPKFTIGVFGWIASPKRPAVVVSAFRAFWASLPSADQNGVELVFVGEVADKSLHPLRLARELAVEQAVRVTGYLDETGFGEEMRKCALVINLRFPSCGETSGTLHHAVGLGIPVILSNYQAFREESAYRHISIAPEKEEEQLIEAIQSVYGTFKLNQPIELNASTKHPFLPPKKTVAQTIDAIFALMRRVC